MSGITSQRRIPAIASLVGAVLIVGEAYALCEGSALPATTSHGSNVCNLATGERPYLGWSFQLHCRDGCGNIWLSKPTVSETARGDCTLVPSQTCMPFFDQLDHANGMYGVTSARDQYVFGGCQVSDTVRFTHGDCECAPSCGEDEETPTQVFQQPGYGSPVLLSLGDGRFELTSAEDGVLFDIDGDGRVERIAWTAAGAGDVFLALDRDGSGAIESGLELFGDSSPQIPSSEANGFRALALFDERQNGGDGDGWIGPGDAVFADLVLWRDEDHDGVSRPGELLPAADAGLEGIDLDHVRVGRRDEHGNQFRYSAATRWRQGGDRLAWDVFFRVLPAP